MVKAYESWLYSQHSTWQLPDLNCMSTSHDPGQPECLPPCVNPGIYMFSANTALPGFAVPGLSKLETEQTNEAHRLLQVLPPRFQAGVPNMYPNLREKQSAFTFGFSGEAKPNDMFGSSQKGFLVFDQSGNQTRLIYSSVCPSVLNPPASVRKLGSFCGLQEDHAIKTDQFTPLKSVLHEESDENNICGEESEMHEDTEEINALLYSGEDSDCSDDDDEVMSTDHSPLAIEVNNKKRGHMEEISEEVACSDSPNKRQKLFNGVYQKASQTDTACSVELEGTHEYDNDAESSCANDQTQGEEVGSIFSNKQCNKDKIRKTLRILQSIIPGVKGKDPLLVLDEAIDHLQSLKLKANALGV